MVFRNTGDGAQSRADDRSNGPTPVDLGDSRDLAAAVRAAWAGDAASEPADPRPEVPRPPLDGRRGGATDIKGDPLAHLKGGTTARRIPGLVPGRFRMAAGPTRVRTLVAAAGVVVAVLVAVAVPIVGGATTPPSTDRPEDRGAAPTTTTSRRSAPTTAFTYPAVNVLAPETTVAPAPPAAGPAVVSPAPTAAPPARTATTSKPRATATTSRPTQAPRPTTTQAPPPPDDSVGDEGSSEPPPYP